MSSKSNQQSEMEEETLRSLKIGDRIFLKIDNSKLPVQPGSFSIFNRQLSIKRTQTDPDFYLVCSNMKGRNLGMCTEEKLNSYSFIGLFEVLRKILADDNNQIGPVTKDQLGFSMGEEVKYGDRIVLRHVYSGGNLMPNLEKPGHLRGSWELQLELSDYVDTEFAPCNQNKSLGDPIHIGESVLIMFSVQTKKYYLNSSEFRFGKWKPSAYISSTNWIVNLFENGWSDHTSIHYGSSILIKGYGLSLKLSKMTKKKNRDIVEDAVHYAVLKSKESSHNLWMLERWGPDGPNTMNGGEVAYEDRVCIRNLASKDYLSKNLEFVEYPAPEDYFVIVKSPNELNRKLCFGTQIILKNADNLIITINENTYIQESLSKIMPQSDEFTVAVNKSSEIELSESQKTHFCLFEISRPSPVAEQLIRELNLIVPYFRKFTDYIKSYGSKDNELVSIARMFSPETGIMYLNDMIEEMIAVIQRLTNLIVKKTDINKCNYMQYFMYKMKIHRASFRLMNALAKRFSCPEDILFGLDEKTLTRLKETGYALWHFLELASENNTKVCKKMARKVTGIVDLLEAFPMHAGKYIAMILEESYPDIDNFDGFARKVLRNLHAINFQNIEFDTCCLKIAHHSIIYNAEVIFSHQETINNILIELGSYFPLKFFVQNSEIMISLSTLNEMSVTSLLEVNFPLSSIATIASEEEICLPVKDFILKYEYASFLVEYLKLYRSLCIGLPILKLKQSHSHIGMENNTIIQDMLRDESTPLSLKKELIKFAVSMLIAAQINTKPSKLCLPMNIDDEKNKNDIIHLGQNKEYLIEMIINWWEEHSTSFSVNSSETEVLSLISLLESSLILAQNDHFELEQLESIALNVAQFLNTFMDAYDNEGEATTRKLLYHERVLKNSLNLFSTYTELKFIEIAEDTVYSILNGPKETNEKKNRNTMVVEIEMIALQESSPYERHNVEEAIDSLAQRDFTSLFQPNIAQALTKVLVNSNKIDQTLHLRTIKILEMFYSTSNQFFKIFSQLELYRPLTIDKYQETIEECKQKLSDPKLQNSLKEGNYFEKIRDLKNSRRSIGKLIELIDSRKKDKYKIFHLQNLMRNYSIFDSVATLWKIISNYEEDPKFESQMQKQKQKTLKTFVAFAYAFIDKNPINQKAIKKKFTYGFYDSIGLLAAVTQQVTKFSHLSGAMTRNYIEVIINSFLFAESKNSPSALKWLIALIFTNSLENSKENQTIISEFLFLKSNIHVKNWDEAKDKESAGETLYILSFCCIDNPVVKKQCEYFINRTILLRILNGENDFFLKRGALSLLFRILKPQENQEYMNEFAGVCSVIIDYFIENLESIKTLASRGAYEMLAPRLSSYRVEIKHSRDFHNELLYLCWTMACKEYTYGYTGLVFYLQQVPELKNNEILEKLKNLKKLIENVFSAKFYTQEIIEGITRTIAKLKNAYETASVYGFDPFTMPTRFINVQYWNSILSKIIYKVKGNYAEKDKSFIIQLTDSFIEELPHFASLEKGKIRDDEKMMILKFLKHFKIKCTTVYQISVFYMFLTNLFSRCKKKRVMSEILIDSGLISEAFNSVQEVNIPKLQLIVLKFLSTISSQNSSIIKDYILDRLKQLDITYSLFSYILSVLRSTTKSLLNHKEPEEGVFKFKLSKGFLKLLASLCDNCNLKFQEFMLVQTYEEESSLKNISMVRVVFEMIADLAQRRSLVSSERQIKVILINALDAMIEFTTGTCPSTQQFLLNNIQTYLVINWLLSVKYDLRQKEDKLLYKNTVNLLSVVTEEDPEFPEKMAKYLDISLIQNQILKLYNNIMKLFDLRDSRKITKFIASSEQEDEDIEDAELLMHSGVTLVIFLIHFEMAFPDHFDIQGIVKRDQCDYNSNALFNVLNFNKENAQSTLKSGERAEITYFKNFIGSVEIQRDDRIHKHYFQIPYRWRFLTKYTAKNLIESVDHSSRVDKLEKLIESLPFIERELKHQQRLRRKKWLHKITKHWEMFGNISYVMLVVVNLCLLIMVNETDDIRSDFSSSYNIFNALLNLSSVLQVLLISLCVGGFALEYYPVIVLRSEHKLKGKLEITDLLMNTGTVLASRNQRLEAHDQMSIRAQIRTLPKTRRVFYFFKNGYILYHTIYLIMAIVSFFYPFYYPIMLLDIMKRSPTLRDLFKAITRNGKQLILAFISGIITVYIFSTIGFLYLSEDFEVAMGTTADYNTSCGNLWECSISTFYMGFRLGGGIGDALIKKEISNDGEDFYWRLIYDLLFFVLINVIFMNIIFGIIIDTFAQLRDIRNEQNYNRENVCFICHNKRTFFEMHGEGFGNHTIESHNVWAYVFFFCYLNDVKINDCTGIEKYVKQCLKKEQIKFFPDNSKFMKENDFIPDRS